MSLSKKLLYQAQYSPENMDLQAELRAIKTATGATRVELSRALVRRFCEFQKDLSNQGNFCGQLGLSPQLTEFIFTGLSSWANGGSLEAALSVEVKPGRPPQTARNQALFEDVRKRVSAGWDVHAACYATAEALQLGDVPSLEPCTLSPSSIRRIYYSVMSAADEDKLGDSESDEQEVSEAALGWLDDQTVSRASEGQWAATAEILRQLYLVCDLVMSNRYLMMIARMTGLNLDVLRFQKNCLKKIVDGESPNEAYGYEPKE